MMLKPFLLPLAIWAAACAAQARDYQAGAIHIEHPHARATGPGQMAGAGYLTLKNTGSQADTLVSARSAVSKTVELHSMRMDGEVMRMREVDAVALPAGQTVAFQPGSWHLMFMGLKAPLKAGESFPLTLRFEKAGEVVVQVKVESAGSVPTMKH